MYIVSPHDRHQSSQRHHPHDGAAGGRELGPEGGTGASEVPLPPQDLGGAREGHPHREDQYSDPENVRLETGQGAEGGLAAEDEGDHLQVTPMMAIAVPETTVAWKCLGP